MILSTTSVVRASGKEDINFFSIIGTREKAFGVIVAPIDLGHVPRVTLQWSNSMSWSLSRIIYPPSKVVHTPHFDTRIEEPILPSRKASASPQNNAVTSFCTL